MKLLPGAVAAVLSVAALSTVIIVAKVTPARAATSCILAQEIVGSGQDKKPTKTCKYKCPSTSFSTTIAGEKSCPQTAPAPK